MSTTIILYVAITWVVLGIISGFLDDSSYEMRRSIFHWLPHILGGGFLLYLTICSLYYQHKLKKLAMLENVLRIVSESFDDEISTQVGEYSGLGSVRIEGKQEMMAVLRKKLEQVLK